MTRQETTKTDLEQNQPPSDQRYFHGTGRRKAAVARVRLYRGSGEITINGRQVTDVFPRLSDQRVVRQPFLLTDTKSKFNVWVKVQGGGISSWADAITLGVARALVRSDDSLRTTLRRGGLLTRDPRVKERKKYGLKRARKAPQYTKR